MGNYLSFAAVSSTISFILEEVNRDVSGIKITTRPLDAIDLQNPTNGLNIFLYLVTPTSALDAVDTLVRDKTGQPTNNPILSLDLHYIITATSSENDDLVAQKILASAMKVLNNYPILLRDTIRNAVRNKEGLEASDLPDQIDDVRLTLNALTTDDLTKIWSRFPNANFRPSVAYVAQVISLESSLVEPAGTIGSVALGNIAQLKSPLIERIEPQILEYAPDAKIIITGNNLKASEVSIEFGDTTGMETKPYSVSDTRILGTVPADVQPGILKVSVNHYLNPKRDGSGDIKRWSVLKSNSSPLVLAPRILSPRQGNASRGKELTVEFEPGISEGRTVFVYMGDRAIPATPIKPDSDSKLKVKRVKLMVPNDLEKGAYLLRVAMDGTSSRLVFDNDPRSANFRKAIGPLVEIVQ